ncbi:tyrosine-protein kinase FRK-like [Planoprotostelium fungivorum]|uniref:Tyrosine-protein kinase FRK-like n=1 Tax=Planoprotostelium fungivorum TaxID=1890364 RepID=A0A2P6NA52_9EUKA|nr:tyrosine-protein kinase FRK-like [Planoprotostelium fungivorum]
MFSQPRRLTLLLDLQDRCSTVYSCFSPPFVSLTRLQTIVCCVHAINRLAFIINFNSPKANYTVREARFLFVSGFIFSSSQRENSAVVRQLYVSPKECSPTDPIDMALPWLLCTILCFGVVEAGRNSNNTFQDVSWNDTLSSTISKPGEWYLLNVSGVPNPLQIPNGCHWIFTSNTPGGGNTSQVFQNQLISGGGSLTISNVAFSGTGSSLNITNLTSVTISSCSIRNQFIYSDSVGSFNIEDVFFADYTLDTLEGHAVFWAQNVTTINMHNVTVTNASASMIQPGTYTKSPFFIRGASRLSIDGMNAYGCTLGYNDAVIETQPTHNRIMNIDISNSTFHDFSSYNGAFYFSQPQGDGVYGNITVANNRFYNLQGRTFLWYDYMSNGENLIITNCTFGNLTWPLAPLQLWLDKENTQPYLWISGNLTQLIIEDIIMDGPLLNASHPNSFLSMDINGNQPVIPHVQQLKLSNLQFLNASLMPLFINITIDDVVVSSCTFRQLTNNILSIRSDRAVGSLFIYNSTFFDLRPNSTSLFTLSVNNLTVSYSEFTSVRCTNLFEVKADGVALINTMFVDNNASVISFGKLQESGHLKITRCQFIRHSTVRAPLLYVMASALVSNSTFSSNNGSIIIWTSGTLNMNRCDLSTDPSVKITSRDNVTISNTNFPTVWSFSSNGSQSSSQMQLISNDFNHSPLDNNTIDCDDCRTWIIVANQNTRIKSDLFPSTTEFIQLVGNTGDDAMDPILPSSAPLIERLDVSGNNFSFDIKLLYTYFKLADLTMQNSNLSSIDFLSGLSENQPLLKLDLSNNGMSGNLSLLKRFPLQSFNLSGNNFSSSSEDFLPNFKNSIVCDLFDAFSECPSPQWADRCRGTCHLKQFITTLLNEKVQMWNQLFDSISLYLNRTNSSSLQLSTPSGEISGMTLEKSVDIHLPNTNVSSQIHDDVIRDLQTLRIQRNLPPVNLVIMMRLRDTPLPTADGASSDVYGLSLLDSTGGLVEVMGTREKGINISMSISGQRNDSIVCRYWNESLNSWEKNGCEVAHQIEGVVVCSCNHLTNFTLTNSPPSPLQGGKNITPILIGSIVGGVALLFIIMAIFYVLFVRHQRKKMSSLQAELKTSLTYEASKITTIEIVKDSRNIVVRRGLYNETISIALKTSKDRIARKQIADEARLLQKIRHPHIIQCLFLYEDGDMGECMMMPWCDDMDLKKKLKKKLLKNQDKMNIACQMAQALSYLQSEGIVHCNICAENVLLSGNEARLAGFSSFSNFSYIDREKSFSIRHSAPEVLNERRFMLPADVWSFGVLLWEIFTDASIPLYDGLSDQEIPSFLSEGGRLPPVSKPAVYDLMTRCWNEDMNARPDAVSMSETLRFNTIGMPMRDSNDRDEGGYQ